MPNSGNAAIRLLVTVLLEASDGRERTCERASGKAVSCHGRSGVLRISVDQESEDTSEDEHHAKKTDVSR